MEEKELKKIFAEKLAKLRKGKGLTQSQLGEVLNYSDKSISKWEREESLPDLVTLCTLSNYFGVNTEYFITDKQLEKIENDNKKFKHMMITILSCGLVWFLAAVSYCTLMLTTNIPYLWFSFIIAIPITFIIFTVFTSIWFNLIYQCLSVSGISWSLCLLLFLTIEIFTTTLNAWLLFTVGAVLQILCVLWFILKFERLKQKRNQKNVDEKIKEEVK